MQTKSKLYGVIFTFETIDISMKTITKKLKDFEHKAIGFFSSLTEATTEWESVDSYELDQEFIISRVQLHNIPVTAFTETYLFVTTKQISTPAGTSVTNHKQGDHFTETLK